MVLSSILKSRCPSGQGERSDMRKFVPIQRYLLCLALPKNRVPGESGVVLQEKHSVVDDAVRR